MLSAAGNAGGTIVVTFKDFESSFYHYTQNQAYSKISNFLKPFPKSRLLRIVAGILKHS